MNPETIGEWGGINVVKGGPAVTYHPDPRIAELEAENARLRGLLERSRELVSIGADIAHSPEFHGNAHHVERCRECFLKREGFRFIGESGADLLERIG